ncbi:MAG: hypothetical protein V2I51_05170 [Anderseniella sp.]|nr:hypothetical protein [Anderseniella sp.]
MTQMQGRLLQLVGSLPHLGLVTPLKFCNAFHGSFATKTALKAAADQGGV